MAIKRHSIFKRKNVPTDFELKQKELLKKSEVSLWLDGYDDLYSDFDPRPNSQRALSQDFLDETKRATRYGNNDQLQLNLLIEEKLRDKREEEIITKRLHDHFEKNFRQIQKERNKVITRGTTFIVIGIICLFLAAFLVFKYTRLNNWVNFLLVVLEPAGWFLAWEGSNIALYRSRDMTPDFEFYQKMSKCEIKFDSY